MQSHGRIRCGNGGRRGAFTLVELLVVIAVISSLLGVLVPVVGRAKVHARRGACRGQLHNIGMALRMYVDDNRNRMPFAAQLPSEEPNLPTITDVLLPYVKEREAMRCPADREDSYFEREGTSYEYPHYLCGMPVDRTFLGKRWGETKTPVLWDFRPFHGREGRPGSMNFLFGDGHVGDLE
ncbi:MAG: type II secretion system protein [Phycisphaerales bacterium]|jgi:prepilin-type N-terminal cleavage/methylation domain-containing protein/prepilin-type processing-associated H-X9-DG protein